MIDQDLDLCAILKQDKNALITKKHNIYQCPLVGHIYAEDIFMLFEHYPAVFPSGSWRIDFDLFTKNKYKEVQLVLASIYVELNYIGDLK